MNQRLRIEEQRRGSATSLPPFHARLYALSISLVLVLNGAAASQQLAPPQPPPKPPVTAPSLPGDSSGSAAKSRFRITGTVINSVTKSPVPKAELTVSHMGSRSANGRTGGRTSQQAGSQSMTATTDAAGHFEIETPSAGGWSLSATAHGYYAQAFDEHEGYSTAIILTEADPAINLTFPLPPASAIEGYVLDEAGEPVRDARLSVSLLPPATPEDQHPRHQVRGSQRTDDRGYYKFSGLLAGDYDVKLQAHPWYASNGGPRFDRGIGFVDGGRIGAVTGSTGSSNPPSSSAPDPLDVVYPILWYPGVSDFSAATPIALRPGEVREADFRLSPIPGFHLRIPAAAPPVEDNRRAAIQYGAYLSQILPDGTEAGVPASARTDNVGNIEFSGLAPGSYIVHSQGQLANSTASATPIQISPNSARTVDLSQPASTTTVTVLIDAAADVSSLQVNFKDLDTGRVSSLESAQNSNLGFRGRRRGRDQPQGQAPEPEDASPSGPKADRSINLQPGRYELSLSGINDLHLTAIEAKGATATGRTVILSGGSPTLMLHVAPGRANLIGFVRSHGVPDAGAMVLLVPATLGDPSGLDIIRRDQSNTDGSFDILNVLPGPYILVAIDHGSDVNWHDPSTLRRFLMHGLPIDLTASGDRKETIEAQSP